MEKSMSLDISKQGGPAFPTTVSNSGHKQIIGLEGETIPAGCVAEYSGMTLRDYFASCAAASDLASVNDRQDAETLAGRERPDGYPRGVDSIRFNMEVEAALRIMFADAMLRALEAK
jgi:hypothetical protein